MAKIIFPRQLEELLAGSELLAPIKAFADKAGEIFADNKLTFFPDYTDHGIEHVNRVLGTEVGLVPDDVWKNSTSGSNKRLLCAVDAAIIIGATILHDIAMHIYPEGFKELIRKDSRFKPLKWFDQNHENYTADIPWFELWENYTREARRFSERQLSNIIGEKSASAWKLDKLPEDPGRWELNHRLIIGEFIRRHHARLAHEIAMYGFPGLSTGFGDKQFPAIEEDTQNCFKRLADLIGLTARSHGISLRVCNEYLDKRYHKLPRPAGSAVLYPMVLLRIADYFQIEQARAPAVLLQLRYPQSPVSLQEWQKHQAVESIDPANDPRGRMITVSNDIPLPLYLQLKELLESLQAEIDQSTAVLDEVYGNRNDLGLDQLNLAVRRIHSNLQTPAFLENLKYVPVKSGFSTDPNLLSLLVEPLYGNHPGVGVRELMQNAVDAVCELDAWCKKHDKKAEELDLPDLGCDVLIEFEKMDDGRWILRVQDRGIGMTSDTIQNYFLRAGASFRHSAEWMQEFLDDDGKPRVARAGRFGIGAFAVFLLGSSFKLWSRHVGAEKKGGFSIEVTAASQLIEIHRESDLKIGTLIEVELGRGTVYKLDLEDKNRFKYQYKNQGNQEYRELNNLIDWFCWDWPKVKKMVKCGNRLISLNQMYECPVKKSKLPLEWSVIHPNGFDAVFWTFDNVPTLSCNGMMIYDPNFDEDVWRDDWYCYVKLKHPDIAVVDSAANLPITIQRYRQLNDTLPFREELERDVLMSFIAYTLICGPNTQAEALFQLDLFPLNTPIFLYDSHPLENTQFAMGTPYRWYSIPAGMVLRDPWLFTLLNTESCCMYGLFDFEKKSFNKDFLKTLEVSFSNHQFGNNNQAMLSWFGSTKYIEEPDTTFLSLLFSGMVQDGIINENMSDESHFLISIQANTLCGSFEQINNADKKAHWRLIEWSNPDRQCLEIKTNSFDSQLPLQQLLVSFENYPFPVEIATLKEIPVLFVAELKIKAEDKPKSKLAKIWNECLEPRYIPFDPVARAELIEHGKKHRELKRHIEAWEVMKRTGSKWATGEWRGNA